MPIEAEPVIRWLSQVVMRVKWIGWWKQEERKEEALGVIEIDLTVTVRQGWVVGDWNSLAEN